MLRYFFFFTIYTITFQPSLCADQRPFQNENSPSESSEMPTIIKYITALEIPFFAGMFVPYLPLFVAFSANQPPPSPKEAEAFVTFGSRAYLVITHIEWLKALISSSQHGKELASFYKETPQDASYEITITLRTQSCFKKPNACLNYRDTILSETKTLQSKKPLELIREANIFVETWIEKNQKNDERTAVELIPCITTKRGKSIVLKSISLIWNKRYGIERDLRELFLISKMGISPTDDTEFSSVFSMYCLAMFIFFDRLARTAAPR